MTSDKIWRQDGVMALVEFISSATGELHDAIVYDTKLEFDPANTEAVRFVAINAMEKARISRYAFSLEPPPPTPYEWPIPSDSSVVPLGEEPKSDTLRALCRERAEREAAAEAEGHVYVPQTGAYVSKVFLALSNKKIRFENQTPDEQKQTLAEERWERIKEAAKPILFAAGVLLCIAVIVVCIRMRM